MMAKNLDISCSIEELNRCCCNCKHHLEDFHHCTTVIGRNPGERCYCGDSKGWICLGEIACDPLNGRAHSGWSEHGECELHEYKEVVIESKAQGSGTEATTKQV
jgi:hypothetical protein